MHGARFWWRSGKRVIRIAWTVWHLVDALLDNAEALAHLLDVHDCAVVTIA
jgi:hypothetical protein